MLGAAHRRYRRDVPLATSLIAASGALALVGAFVLRRRLPAPIVLALLSLAGAGLGVGGMLLQHDPPAWEFAVAVALLVILVPAHVRIVLGPFGPTRRSA